MAPTATQEPAAVENANAPTEAALKAEVESMMREIDYLHEQIRRDREQVKQDALAVRENLNRIDTLLARRTR